MVLPARLILEVMYFKIFSRNMHSDQLAIIETKSFLTGWPPNKSNYDSHYLSSMYCINRIFSAIKLVLHFLSIRNVWGNTNARTVEEIYIVSSLE